VESKYQLTLKLALDAEITIFFLEREKHDICRTGVVAALERH